MIQAAVGQRPHIEVFGRLPTPDGTCVRDYIHVDDLAEAHCWRWKATAGSALRYNVGTGRGYSVREVIRTVEEVVGNRCR